MNTPGPSLRTVVWTALTALALTCSAGWALARSGEMKTSRFGPGQEALEAAILVDDRAAVARAVAAGAKVNARDSNQVTPLMMAVDRLKQQAAAELLARGADPNLRAVDGASAVSLAVENHAKAPELMLSIFRAGGDPNMRNRGNDPVIMRFVNDQNCELIRQMKALGADIDALTRSRRALVLDAALGSDWDVVWCLLELGAKYDYAPGPPEHNLTQMLGSNFPAPDSPIYSYKVKVRDFLRSKGLPTPPLRGDAVSAPPR